MGYPPEILMKKVTFFFTAARRIVSESVDAEELPSSGLSICQGPAGREKFWVNPLEKLGECDFHDGEITGVFLQYMALLS